MSSLEDLAKALKQMLQSPDLAEDLRQALEEGLAWLSTLQATGAREDLEKEVAEKIFQEYLRAKGGFDVRVKDRRVLTPEAAAERLVAEANSFAQKRRPPGGPGLGGPVSRPEPMDADLARQLDAEIKKAVERARRPGRGGGP